MHACRPLEVGPKEGRITLYVERSGPRVPSTDHVPCCAADPQVPRHVEHPDHVRALVEVHRAAVLTVRPAVLGHRGVSFTGADQQGAAPLMHDQGLDLNHDIFW